MQLKRKTLLITVMATLVLPATLLPSIASASPTHRDDGPESAVETQLLASGLQGTSGGALGPDGAFYVTEAKLGQITRIDPRSGEKSLFAAGLPKRVIGLGGAIDVAFLSGTAYALVTLVGPDVGGNAVDGIYRMDDADSFTVIADLGEFSRNNPPTTSFDLAQGLQFAFDTYRGGFLVTDGHHNRVLRVASGGDITEVIQFGNIVPTGLAVSRRTVYLAEAGPVPHNPADGKVVSFDVRNPVVTDIASGFSLLVDVEFNRCGVLYALSQGDSPGDVTAGSPALPNSGELLRVNDDGTMSVVVDKLNLPTSVDFKHHTAFIVTMGGEVLKVTGLKGGGQHHRSGRC